MTEQQSFQDQSQNQIYNNQNQMNQAQQAGYKPIYSNSYPDYQEYHSNFENPLGIIIISVLNLLIGTIGFFVGAAILFMYVSQSAFLQNRAWGFQILLTNPATVILEYGGLILGGSFIFIVGIFMLMKKNWARISEIIISIIGAVTSLILIIMAIINGKIGAFIVFLIQTTIFTLITLYLLLKNDVKIAFTYGNNQSNYQKFSS